MRRAGSALTSTLVALSFVAGACRSHEPTPSGAKSVAARASSVPSASPKPREVAPAPPAPPVGCRVLAVKAPEPPPPGTPRVGLSLAGPSFIDVPAGVELAIKHGETTRELSLRGPGRFLACLAGAESVFIARGSVGTTPGPGARAGAEVMLATPFGVLEYADANLRVDVTNQGMKLEVTQGSVTIGASLNEERPGGTPPKPVRPPAGHYVAQARLDAPGMANRCLEAERALVAEAGTKPSLERGAWAVRLMARRKAMRLWCARARAAAGTLEEPARAALENQLPGRKTPGGATGESGEEAGTDAQK